jgi:hypothetical protein
VISRVLYRIDPHDLIVWRRPYELLQLPNEIVMVRITRDESVETLSKTRLPDRGYDTIHGRTSIARESAKIAPWRENTFDASKHSAGLFG